MALGLAQADAVDDRGVVEGVGDDRVLLGQEGLEQATVGVEAGAVEDRVFGAEELGQGVLELLVLVEGAADEAHARHAIAALVEGVAGGGDGVGVTGEAEVIVGAEVEDLGFVTDDGDLGALGGVDDALVLVEAGFFDLGQNLGVVGFGFFEHGIL